MLRKQEIAKNTIIKRKAADEKRSGNQSLLKAKKEDSPQKKSVARQGSTTIKSKSGLTNKLGSPKNERIACDEDDRSSNYLAKEKSKIQAQLQIDIKDLERQKGASPSGD